MVNTTPITTKYTPISKNKAVPTAPITGTDSANHTPVITGNPTKTGSIALRIDKDRPIPIKRMGENWNKAKVCLVLYAKECKTKAIEAINPPTNPPPER